MTQSLFEALVSDAMRRVQLSAGATDQDLADVIGCSAATVGNARNRNGKLSAHTLFNLLAVDPLALESLLAHFDRRSVPITAKCDTDALPTLSASVHRLAVAQSPDSPGGSAITNSELLTMLPDLRDAIECLNTLVVKAERIAA